MKDAFLSNLFAPFPVSFVGLAIDFYLLCEDQVC